MLSTIKLNKKLIFLFTLLGFICFSWPAGAVSEKTETGVKANLSSSEKAAVDSLISQYFDFLFSGNMNGLKSISVGELYSQVERFDTNPGYSDFLRKQYLNAGYEIVDYRMNSNNQLLVAVKVLKENSADSDFLIYINRDTSNTESGQSMRIELTEKQ